MHLADAAPVEGELVTVEGWLTYYDEGEKSWKPLRGKLHVYVDGVRVGETESNNYGMFSYSFPAPSEGKHKLEVRFKGKFGYEASYKVLDFQVIKIAEKRRIARVARVVAIALLVLVFLMVLSVFIAKFRPP